MLPYETPPKYGCRQVTYADRPTVASFARRLRLALGFTMCSLARVFTVCIGKAWVLYSEDSDHTRGMPRLI